MSKTESLRTLIIAQNHCALIGVRFLFERRDGMKAKKNVTLSIGFKEKQPSSRKSIEKKPQKLTERDLKNLMGIDRPIYKRGRGRAFRQQ